MTVPIAKAKRQKKARPVLEAVSDDHPGNSKFARALGSGDYQTRHQGVQALARWLVRKDAGIKEADMMKIWKGLFYCFWHSDKAPVQAELAERLAAILPQLSEQCAYLFFTSFMTTMRREWFGIDRLRLDKFLMLIRKFVRHMLACLKAAEWRADLVERYSAFLRDAVLLPADTLPALGVAYHCADLLLDELRGVAEGKAVPGAGVAALLAPFGAALRVAEQAALNRIGEGLFDSLLSELASPSDDSPYLQQLDVAALAAQLFELGAAPDTRARNRKVLYDLSGALERTQHKRQRVSTGADAGPSTRPAEDTVADGGKKAAGKKSKKQQQQEPAAELAQAPAAEAAATTPAAVTGKAKRKAAAAAQGDEPAKVQAAQQQVEAEAEVQQQQGPKSGKKRQRGEGAGKGSPPEAEVKPAAGSSTGKGSAKAAPAEPASGQKAALRAAVAKVASPAAEAPLTATRTPRQKRAQKGAEQEQDEVVAASIAVSAGKATALGKRGAPGSNAKATAGGGAGATPSGRRELPGANGDASEPTAAKAAGTGADGLKVVASAKKGRVVINLKKNLYFAHGGPVPDPDIRTPPPARSKGGILKRTAALSCPPKVASVAAAAAPKSGAKPQRVRVLPKQARRASAAAFF